MRDSEQLLPLHFLYDSCLDLQTYFLGSRGLLYLVS